MSCLNQDVSASTRATRSCVQPQLVPLITWPHSASRVHVWSPASSASAVERTHAHVGGIPPLELPGPPPAPPEPALVPPVAPDDSPLVPSPPAPGVSSFPI